MVRRYGCPIIMSIRQNDELVHYPLFIHINVYSYRLITYMKACMAILQN